MGAHAMLSASGASRWLACSPSARYEKNFADQTSEYADEGTLAHELSNLLIQQKVYDLFIEQELEAIRAHKLYSEEMYNFCDTFAEYISQKYTELGEGATLMLEEKVDLRRYIPEGFGTTDVTMAAGLWLHVDDLKYGKGVPVDAYENKQLMIYALGALEVVGLLYNIKYVKLTVYQPRIDNISSYEISVENLVRWANEELAPGAITAWNGEGEYKAGDHCRFCRGRTHCPTLAAFNLQAAKFEFTEIPMITDAQMVKILSKAKSLKKWVTSIEEYALRAAIFENKKWPNMKVVEGRSTRKYTDEKAIIKGLLEAGYSEDKIVNKKILGITDLSKKIAKLDFQSIVEPNLIKPDGKPTLVHEDDRRPEYNANAAAAIEFSSEEDEE